MSSIWGTWQYKEDESTEQVVEKMSKALQSFFYEKHFIRSKSQTGFGFLKTLNTPESVYENQPVYLPEEQLLFTSQGRIDNRLLLAKKLNLKIDKQYPDGTLILKAYLRWGKECVNHLRGDWSFAVFNFKEQELFLARDPMGYTAIYYYRDETGFYFSSSIKALLTLPSYYKQLNELHFIRWLSLWDKDKSNHDTYYNNIFSIPIAHTLSVKDKRIKVQKYWQPENINIRNYKNKQHYVDEMLEIFSNAVKSRLRSYKPVASMLSGGLDSSTVSFVAADLLKQEKKVLTTFSHVPLFAEEMKLNQRSEMMILDETPLINTVAKASGNIAPVMLNSVNYTVAQGMIDTLNIYDAPLHAASNFYWLLDIYRTTSERGFGALLTGEGGNGSISFAAMDYLLPFNFLRFKNHPKRFIRSQIIKPLVYNYFNYILNKKKRINDELEEYVLNMFFNPSLLEQYNILQDIKTNNKGFNRYIHNIQMGKDQFINLYSPRSSVGAAFNQHYGIELRDPTTDVNVMEYFFSIPNDVFFDEHYNNRMLVKRMMKGKIPDSVLFEKKKGLQSADIAYRVKAQALELTSAFENVKHSPAANHYIDVKKLSETWQQYLVKPYVEPYEVQRLLKALQFALFLQMNFD